MKITFLSPPKTHRGKKKQLNKTKTSRKKINSSVSEDGGGDWKKKHIYTPETSVCSHLWILKVWREMGKENLYLHNPKTQQLILGPVSGLPVGS